MRRHEAWTVTPHRIGEKKMLRLRMELRRLRSWRMAVLWGLLVNVQAAVAADKAVGDATEQLRGWSKLVEQRLFQVGGRVHTAVGYTLSANSMIVGEDGLIIIDPGHAPALSAKVRTEFERISDKPVVAIIFTHGHGDHFGGAAAFLDEGRDVSIWARQNFGAEMRANSQAGLTPWRRPAETQGGDLPPEQQIRFNGPVQVMTDGQADPPLCGAAGRTDHRRRFPQVGCRAGGNQRSAVRLVARGPRTVRRRQCVSHLAQCLSVARRQPFPPRLGRTASTR